MDQQLHFQPPIQPISQPSASIPPQEALILSKDNQNKLIKYLPSPRDTFLSELAAHNPWRSIPHVTLTYAQSLDSQISLHPGQRTTLSGFETKSMTHFLRAHHDAILIGAGTANADNPGLNTRYSKDGTNIVELESQPRPFILDPGRSWKQESCEKLFGLARQGAGRAPWWLVSEDQVESEADAVRTRRLKEVGGNYIRAGRYGSSADGVEWETILRAMWDAGVRSVMIEGGATVINDLLRARNQHLISSIIVTIAPTYLGSGGVVVAPPRTKMDQNEAFLRDLTWIPMGQDIVMAGVLHDA